MKTTSGKSPGQSSWFSWLPVVPIWLAFFGWSMLRVPVPAVNEPHYLGKARHWWNPAWCPGDFFLDSSNPHLVFYSTFGWFAESCSLPVAAIIGRALGLLILACGWQRLSLAITSRRWGGLLAVPLFLMLQSLGNLSGEWLVGGIEAKVPAYGFLFWAVGNLLTGRFLPAAVTAGLSASFHPLVGLWGVVAAIMAAAYCCLMKPPVPTFMDERKPPSLDRPNLRDSILMAVLFLVTALPGIRPAFQALQSRDPNLERVANQLQVAGRLSHHLDPMHFSQESFRYWGMMIVLWLLLQSLTQKTPQQRWWKAFVVSTILIAVAGMVIGWGPRPVTLMPGYEWRLKLLKFYFFRLGDQMVPVALSLSAINFCLEARELKIGRWVMDFNGAAGLFATLLGACFIHFPDENPSRMNTAQLSDWISACDWIKAHSRDDESTYVTDSGWAVKWYAERPEYVSYKDMPQDAANINEWNRRLWVIARWRIAAMQDGLVTAEELAELRKQTGIHYLICRRFGPITPAPAYSNDTFRVYALPE